MRLSDLIQKPLSGLRVDWFVLGFILWWIQKVTPQNGEKNTLVLPTKPRICTDLKNNCTTNYSTLARKN